MDNSSVHGEYEGGNLDDMIDEFEERVENDPDVTIEDLISDYEKPLYGGCDKYTRLSGVLKLYNSEKPRQFARDIINKYML
uniref:Uncharacterized protein n=1 Tax=Chenopodium quinoa TaxID=63459 RepID=A0A803N9P7_CHEQI